jgi:hypothetical protein
MISYAISVGKKSSVTNSRAEELELCHGSQVWPASAMMAAIVDNVISAAMAQRFASEVVSATSLLPITVAAHAAIPFNSSSHTQGIAQASSGGNRITRYSSAERRKGRQVKKFEYRKYDFKIPAASSVPFR